MESSELTDQVSIDVPQLDVKKLPIVVLGASAGGLVALEEFLNGIPPTIQAAFVVIQHLSPDYRSFLDQLLQRHTLLAVRSIENGTPVEPQVVYVLPPNKEAILCQSRLLLSDRSQERPVIYPIDDFLRTLANEAGDQAIAVIFSGTGADGSRGIRDLHAAGGFVIAQSPETAAFSGMPKNAIATGMVDLVLSPREAAKAIVRKLERPTESTIATRDHGMGFHELEPELEMALGTLRNRSGVDHTDFQPSVVFDALHRRQNHTGLFDAATYAAAFLKNDNEMSCFLSELLDSASSEFFCDDAAYERLSQDVVPTLMSAIPEDQDFRAWVIGCGTGEEAYTLAILLADWYEQKGLPMRVKIFASDVHADSLAIASKAVYRAGALAQMHPARREKYFIERPDGYHVVPELRKMVVFTPHNCLREAPFTRMDMVCCRRLLHRFSHAAQAKAFGFIHFALRDNGILFVDSDARLGEIGREFLAIQPEQGIFAKHRLAGAHPAGALARLGRDTSGGRQMVDGRASQRDLLELYDQLLEAHIPAGWLISDDGTLLHTFRDAGKYLENKGRLKSDIVSLVLDELRGPLLLLIRHVTETKAPLEINNVRLGGLLDKSLTMRGEPLPTRSGRNGILISVLEHSQPTARANPTAAYLDLRGNDVGQRTELERELELTRENLQLTIQDLRIANEELKEFNEEVTCANEELHSANEELHSVNEELHTVNAEHQRKIDELTALNDDMDNLLTNSNVHTLFLTRDLRLRLFTPRIVDLFNLIPQDIGRHIATFNHNLVGVSLVQEAEKVLRDDCAFRAEVQGNQGNWFVLRITPYLSRGNVEGVVITLVDITSQKNSQNALLRSEQRFELAVQGSNEGIWDWPNTSEEKVWCSPRFYSILGHSPDDFTLTHSIWIELIHPDDRQEFERVLDSGGPFNLECRIERSDNSYRWVRICGASYRDALGQPVRMAGSLEDVTDRHAAQEAARNAVLLRDRFLAMLSHELRNPLGAVLGAIQLHDEGSEKRDLAISVIRRQAMQMARLLDDLLDVSRISNNKFELLIRTVDIQEIIISASAALQLSASQRNLRLLFEPLGEPVWTNGDSQRLEQVMVNLLNNAIKYSPPGGLIEITLQRQASTAIICVKDSGVGIAPDMQAKVFDLFVQSEATLDRADGGMGVGLTLVKAIVDMHGGKVSVRSDGLNLGSVFTVELPISESQLEPPKVAEATDTQSLNVVVVEDMEDSREMLAELLAMKGHIPQVAGDGAVGLQLIREAKPDLALVDIGLPVLNGFEIARQLRADTSYDRVRLIALTGYGQASDREAIRAAGFDDHIVKPLKPEDLSRALNSCNTEWCANRLSMVSESR